MRNEKIISAYDAVNPNGETKGEILARIREKSAGAAYSDSRRGATAASASARHGFWASASRYASSAAAIVFTTAFVFGMVAVSQYLNSAENGGLIAASGFEDAGQGEKDRLPNWVETYLGMSSEDIVDYAAVEAILSTLTLIYPTEEEIEEIIKEIRSGFGIVIYEYFPDDILSPSEFAQQYIGRCPVTGFMRFATNPISIFITDREGSSEFGFFHRIGQGQEHDPLIFNARSNALNVTLFETNSHYRENYCPALYRISDGSTKTLDDIIEIGWDNFKFWEDIWNHPAFSEVDWDTEFDLNDYFDWCDTKTIFWGSKEQFETIREKYDN